MIFSICSWLARHCFNRRLRSSAAGSITHTCPSGIDGLGSASQSASMLSSFSSAQEASAFERAKQVDRHGCKASCVCQSGSVEVACFLCAPAVQVIEGIGQRRHYLKSQKHRATVDMHCAMQLLNVCECKSYSSPYMSASAAGISHIRVASPTHPRLCTGPSKATPVTVCGVSSVCMVSLACLLCTHRQCSPNAFIWHTCI